MTNFNTSELHESDALLNDSLSNADGEAAFPEDDEALRLARIDEFAQESLREEHTLGANVGGFMSGLMKISVQFEKITMKCLELHSDAIQDSPQLNRSAKTYLDMLRQIDRFANLKARLAEDGQRITGIKSQRRRAIVPGSMLQPGVRTNR